MKATTTRAWVTLLLALSTSTNLALAANRRHSFYRVQSNDSAQTSLRGTGNKNKFTEVNGAASPVEREATTGTQRDLSSFTDVPLLDMIQSRRQKTMAALFNADEIMYEVQQINMSIELRMSLPVSLSGIVFISSLAYAHSFLTIHLGLGYNYGSSPSADISSSPSADFSSSPSADSSSSPSADSSSRSYSKC